MAKIAVFGGTSESRKLVEYFVDTTLEIHTYVATEYGETLLPKANNIVAMVNRLNQVEMEAYIEKNHFDMVIDATHPYAVLVSKNIIAACSNTGTEYRRIVRKSIDYRETLQMEDNLIYVDSVAEAVKYLQDTQGNIAITTGSKELREYIKLDHYKSRCYARVLPIPSIVEECRQFGFEEKNLCCMQGPFTEEFNYGYLKQIKASYLVTKESGYSGGFSEKLSAAKRANTKTIVVGRPTEEAPFQKQYSCEKIIEDLVNDYQITLERKITVVGIGMGSLATLTMEARVALKNGDVIIGANSILENCREMLKEFYGEHWNSEKKQHYVITYQTNEIVRFIRNHAKFENIVIAFSGDIGFYSGAKKLLPELKAYQVHTIMGISAPVYFLGKIGVSWNDTVLISAHEKRVNLISKMRRHSRVFVLLGGTYDVNSLCKELCEFGFEDVDVTVGERLSFPEERIIKGKPGSLLKQEFQSLAVALIENKNANKQICSYGMEDEAFIRGEVPMTKRDIRGISLNKLMLTKDAIVFDIGAGTGSISVEVAGMCEDGVVYAIEKNVEGVALIRKNATLFSCDNLIIVEGTAPACLQDLPTPTHVFIGGSSGNLLEMISEIMKISSPVRVVMNAISLETVSQTLAILEKFKLIDFDMIQVNIAKSKKVGSHHMMMAQNPITIISFTSM